MIDLREDVIFVKRDNGRCAALTLDELARQITTHPTIGVIEMWVARQIAHAVLHYFRSDLGREVVEQTELNDVLQLVLERCTEVIDRDEPSPTFSADLRKLAIEAGHGSELVFFHNLGSTLRQLRDHRAKVIQFTGLRACVKVLAGTKIWSKSCRRLEHDILTFLRSRASTEHGCRQSLLVVH
jgi:hypothetical protein